jgi:hypothetical protein
MPDPTAPDPAPLRPALGPDGSVCLDRADATRLVLALKHLASFAHWSPTARPYDEAIAEEAEWMAESLGDAVLTLR